MNVPSEFSFPEKVAINNQKANLKAAWLLIGLCTLLRLFYGGAFLLTPDETNYWQWSRHLDWGYYDQTPLIAWAIRLATILFGQSELSVRLPSVISMAVASIYLVQIGARWFSSRIAWHTALISQTVLIFNVGGILATADGLQGASWVGASYHVARALEDRNWRSWLLSGIWLGVGLLSKYTMVLMPAGVVLFALFSARHRDVFKRPHPYVACLTALVIFSPVIIWNANHQWNSIRHVAYLGGADQTFRIHLNFLTELLASQMGLLSPLVFLLVVASWYWVARRRFPTGQWLYLFLFFTSFPILLGFGILSLHTRVYANWPCAAYLTATVLIAARWALRTGYDKRPATVRKVWGWTVATSAGLTLLVFTQTVWPVLPIPVRYDRAAHEIVGWDLLGDRVSKIVSGMPGVEHTFIFGLTYQVASELAFYTPGQPFTVAINRWNRPNVYDYWWEDRDLIGKDGVGVLGDARSRKRLLELFERVDNPIPLAIHRTIPRWKHSNEDSLIRIFYIYPCFGFKGGLRWVPSNRNDIRNILK